MDIGESLSSRTKRAPVEADSHHDDVGEGSQSGGRSGEIIEQAGIIGPAHRFRGIIPSRFSRRRLRSTAPPRSPISDSGRACATAVAIGSPVVGGGTGGAGAGGTTERKPETVRRLPDRTGWRLWILAGDRPIEETGRKSSLCLRVSRRTMECDRLLFWPRIRYRR